MQLEGIHHITAITGDAPRNVDFYARVLGLRMVKKTVNQDDPTIYHLFYADEHGDPGSDLTFFEYPGAVPGRPGAGMIHRIIWRVGSDEAIDFWEKRLGGEGVATERHDGRLRFKDPEGLEHELAVVDTSDEPLIAEHAEVPHEMALQGFHGVRAYSADPEASRRLLEETLGFKSNDDGWEVRGDQRGSLFAYDPPPAEPGIQSGGSVHHVAFATQTDEQEAWHDRLRQNGVRATPIIDRFWFRSIYFREPSGVLFELATMGPGFATDEDMEHLGERLTLPPDYERYRERLEETLTPLPDVRQWRPSRVS